MDEWRRAYLNYHGLKKLIKRVKEHRDTRLIQSFGTEQKPLPSSTTDTTLSPASRLLRSGTTLFARKQGQVANYGAIPSESSDPESQWPPVPNVSLEGTGLRISDDSEVEEEECAPTHQRNAERLREDDLLSTPYAVPSDRLKAAKTRERDSTSPSATPSTTSASIYPGDASQTEAPSSHAFEPLETLLVRLLDDEERKFFRALDCEVERITRFYNEREHEAVERLSTLVTQLLELAEHRRAYKAQTKRIGNGQLGLKHILSRVPRSLDASEMQRLRLSTQGLEPQDPEDPNAASQDGEDLGNKRREYALEQVQNLRLCPVPSTPPRPATPSMEDHSHQHQYQYDPVHYKAARKKLRTAVIESYRALEILNNYAILNRTGFNKILKKFDKTLETQIWHLYYDTRIAKASIVASDTVPRMIHALEEIFANYFEHGNRKRARDLLRAGAAHALMPHDCGHSASTFITGLYLGVALCLTVEGLQGAMKSSTQAQIPLWPQLLVVYSALFLPTLFALLFGLNLIAWQHVRINVVFIFEFDAANTLEPVQYFEIPAFFLFLLSLCFFFSFAGNAPEATLLAPTMWPYVWLGTVFGLLVNPLPIMYKSSRRWFVRTCARVLSGGLVGSVEFRDFFIGDELNSIAYSVSNLWLMACEYRAGWIAPNMCVGSASLWTPVLSSAPAFLRLLQCVRRHYDSHGSTCVHLINAAKYASTILHAFAYFAYRTTGSQSTLWFVAWILCATINSSFTSTWDILMDWNLLHADARFPLLRMHLSFDDIWPMYYFAMVSNVAIRFIWIIYLFGTSKSVPIRAFIAASLEMLRRWQWNFLRLENEHVGNADTYKIVRDLPLPYPVQRRPESTADEEDELGTGDSEASRAPSMSQPNVEDQLFASLTETRMHLDQHRQQETTSALGRKGSKTPRNE